MKKRYIISLISIVGVIGACLKKYVPEKLNKKDNFALSIEKAGIPDQMDIKTETQLENSKMVSEGSQFGVQYFNEIAEEQIQK